MAEQPVLYTKEEGIAVITLNRPDKLNTTTSEMMDRLGELTEEIKTDDEVSVVIVTGNGRAFCAGADIGGGSFPAAQAQREIKEAKKKISTESRGSCWFFNSIPKPTICAINGAAVGIGAEFALYCDFRIAAQSARWGEVFVQRGFTVDTGAGTYLLPRIVGLSKACELIFTGEIIKADEMLKIGLVSQVVPDEELLPAAMEMAKRLKKGGPLAIQICKKMIYRGLEDTMEAHQQAIRYYFRLSTQSEDGSEGVKSFLEKRPPKWVGR
jgi:enoyl-CoA hydratase/carnithine racemase